MAPKEKAMELVGKYFNASFNCKDCNMPYCDVRCTSLHESEAKQCAIIAVDEILNFQENLIVTEGSLAYQYWIKVKAEIEKL